MFRNSIFLLCVPFFSLAHAATADTDFVTDAALCPLSSMERHEKGMSFDGQSFWEIEYHCEIDGALPALDWSTDQTFIKAGYCEEPGALMPTVFVFRTFTSEPRVLYVYEGQGGEPVLYHLCKG